MHEQKFHLVSVFAPPGSVRRERVRICRSQERKQIQPVNMYGLDDVTPAVGQPRCEMQGALSQLKKGNACLPLRLIERGGPIVSPISDTSIL